MAKATKTRTKPAKRTPSAHPRTLNVKAALRAIEKARILIVANDPQTMSDMQDPEVVRLHEIEIALNADMAKTILAERHMDVLAMDTACGTGDHVDQLKSVREEFPRLPIIAIGDKKTKGIERRIKQAGANYFITRPLDSGSVTRTIGRALLRAAKRHYQ